jgi:hypothetical protein
MLRWRTYRFRDGLVMRARLGQRGEIVNAAVGGPMLLEGREWLVEVLGHAPFLVADATFRAMFEPVDGEPEGWHLPLDLPDN